MKPPKNAPFFRELRAIFGRPREAKRIDAEQFEFDLAIRPATYRQTEFPWPRMPRLERTLRREALTIRRGQ